LEEEEEREFGKLKVELFEKRNAGVAEKEIIMSVW
jgi:hypothetical protein